MAGLLDFGTDAIPKSSSALSEKEDSVEPTQLKKVLNVKSVKHREQLYWLKLELDSTRKEKQAVEERMQKLYSDLQDLKALGGGGGGGADDSNNNSSGGDMEALLQKHERAMQTMQSQMNLLRESSDSVVHSLKDEIRDVMDEKARSEMELMNFMTDLEKEKETLSKKLEGSGSASNSELEKEIQQLKKEKTLMAEELRRERTASREIIAVLRQDKTQLTEQVEKMQADLLVLRASVDTVNSIDQMKQDRDESLKALERVGVLWDRADGTLQHLETLMGPLEDKEGEDASRFLGALESASLLHGQVKVSLMLIELKLRNTLACLKNDSSQLAVAVTDPEISKQIETAEADALKEIRTLSSQVEEQMQQLEARSEKESEAVQNTLQSKMAQMKELKDRQVQLEKDIHKMSVEELSATAREHSSSENQQVELFVSRKILERLQAEVLAVVQRVRDKNETIARLEATVEEMSAREKTLTQELKRLMKAHTNLTLLDRDKLPLKKLLEETNNASAEFVEEEYEEEIIEEEIIEDGPPSRSSSVPIIEEEEEEVLEE